MCLAGLAFALMLCANRFDAACEHFASVITKSTDGKGTWAGDGVIGMGHDIDIRSHVEARTDQANDRVFDEVIVPDEEGIGPRVGRSVHQGRDGIFGGEGVSLPDELSRPEFQFNTPRLGFADVRIIISLARSEAGDGDDG